MGGINHKPTKQVSLRYTVPGAKMVSEAFVELMQGNSSIEDVVMLTGDTLFGAGRASLQEAASHFQNVVFKLEAAKSYTSKVNDTIANPEYEPFDLKVVGDIGDFIGSLQLAGLLPDAAAANEAVEVTRTEGYRGMFWRTDEFIDRAIVMAQKLCDTTTPMVDGPEGRQGYFWDNVESNRNTWRQDFMRALTAIQNLLMFWQTTAAICTEAHYRGAVGTSLLIEAGLLA